MNNNEKLIQFLADNQIQLKDIFTKDDVKKWLNSNDLSMLNSTLTCQLCQHSTNDPTRVHYRAKEKHDLFFRIDTNTYRRFDPCSDPDPIYEKGTTPTSPGDDINDETEIDEREFAYEKDLQAFLAKNLDLIEKGLTLYEDAESSITGIEVNAGRRRIDMLLLDKDKNFVVVELKVSRGYDRVVGQTLRYMGWIRQNFADENQGVRGIIIARDISNDLIIATSEVKSVSLMEYELKVSLKQIETTSYIPRNISTDS